MHNCEPYRVCKMRRSGEIYRGLMMSRRRGGSRDPARETRCQRKMTAKILNGALNESGAEWKILAREKKSSDAVSCVNGPARLIGNHASSAMPTRWNIRENVARQVQLSPVVASSCQMLPIYSLVQIVNFNVFFEQFDRIATKTGSWKALLHLHLSPEPAFFTVSFFRNTFLYCYLCQLSGLESERDKSGLFRLLYINGFSSVAVVKVTCGQKNQNKKKHWHTRCWAKEKAKGGPVIYKMFFFNGGLSFRRDTCLHLFVGRARFIFVCFFLRKPSVADGRSCFVTAFFF